MTFARPLDPRVRAKIRGERRRFKTKCARYEHLLNRMLEQVFEHGPLERERMDPEATKHPEFHDLFDSFTVGDQGFWDLSGMGRYHMTGDHAAIDEKPWRPTAKSVGSDKLTRDV